MLKDTEIRKQSEQAVRQWDSIWSKHCKIHKKEFPEMKSLDDFHNIGIGKSLILVVSGASFEKDIETLKEKQNNCDILCCDKTLGHLLKAGIKPTYCLVCDASVDYKLYMEEHKDQLQDTILFMCVSGNVEWSMNGNWKDKYFFANKDILGSEKKYMELSGCKNAIPAATNVSNALLVFVTQADNMGYRNHFGYDVYGLVGFDYSWTQDGSYYAFNKDGDGKHNYMRHIHMRNTKGKRVFTSTNLEFSAKWITKYNDVFKLPLVQCSDSTIFDVQKYMPLGKVMDYTYKVGDSIMVRSKAHKARKLQKELSTIKNELNNIGSDHLKSYASFR